MPLVYDDSDCDSLILLLFLLVLLISVDYLWSSKGLSICNSNLCIFDWESVIIVSSLSIQITIIIVYEDQEEF